VTIPPEQSGPVGGPSDPAGVKPVQADVNSVQPGGNSNPNGGIPNQITDDQPDDTINVTIVWFLGLALLALVGTLIGLSVTKTTFPDGVTSLASLIAGGLLGIVNPTRAIKQRSTQGSARRTPLSRRPPALPASGEGAEPGSGEGGSCSGRGRRAWVKRAALGREPVRTMATSPSSEESSS
jgi:hypothetical protein